MVSRFSQILERADKGRRRSAIALTSPHGLDSWAPVLQGDTQRFIFYPVVAVPKVALTDRIVVLEVNTGQSCWYDFLELLELVTCSPAIG